MAIRMPADSPAASRLREEGVTVVAPGLPGRARALRIGLVNLMPRKEATELAFARLLAQSGREIELSFILPASYEPRNASAEHIARFYRRWPDVRSDGLDGLIVTGAPVETLAFEDVSYWREMREIVEWAAKDVGCALYVCWAGQAALHVLRGIEKRPLPRKAFGVFERQVTDRRSLLLRGMGGHFPVPVSRHTEIAEEALVKAGIAPIARSSEAGACIVDDTAHRAVCIFDHLEYDEDTLLLEYERDRAAGKDTAPPRNAEGGAPWRPFAALFFRNWLDRVAYAARKARFHEAA